MTDVNSIGSSAASSFARLPGQQQAPAANQRAEARDNGPSSRATVSAEAQQRLETELARAETTPAAAEVSAPSTGLQQRIESLGGPRSLLETQNATNEAAGVRTQQSLSDVQAQATALAEAQTDVARQRDAQQQPTPTDPERSDNSTDLTA